MKPFRAIVVFISKRGAHTLNRVVCVYAVVFLTLSLTTIASAVDSEKSIPPVEVKKIQQFLKDRGWNPGPIDGVVGPRTRRAVKNFQSCQGLPVTGRIDSLTFRLLAKDMTAQPLKAPENLRVIEIGEED